MYPTKKAIPLSKKPKDKKKLIENPEKKLLVIKKNPGGFSGSVKTESRQVAQQMREWGKQKGGREIRLHCTRRGPGVYGWEDRLINKNKWKEVTIDIERGMVVHITAKYSLSCFKRPVGEVHCKRHPCYDVLNIEFEGGVLKLNRKLQTESQMMQIVQAKHFPHSGDRGQRTSWSLSIGGDRSASLPEGKRGLMECEAWLLCRRSDLLGGDGRPRDRKGSSSRCQ